MQLRLPCLLTVAEARLEARRRWGRVGYAKEQDGLCEVGVSAPAWWVVLGRGTTFESAFGCGTRS